MHLTRYAMYRRIGAAIGCRLEGRILGISDIRNFRQWIAPGSEVVEVSYPQVDMQRLPFGDGAFDVVISDQVIGHLPDPKQAMAEAFRVLKPGGLGIHTARATGPLWPDPGDYFRLTREGLRALCPPDAEVLQLDSWGNRWAIGLMLLRDGFFRFLPIPERPGLRRWLATCDDKRHPIHTWIVARKPQPRAASGSPAAQVSFQNSSASERRT